MTVLSTPAQIELARLLTLRAGVRLERIGLHRRGRTCSAIAREALGLPKRAPREAVMAALNETIAARMAALGDAE